MKHRAEVPSTTSARIPLGNLSGLSNDLFNKRTGLCMACPITNSRRDYPFHLPIPEGQKVTGFVMAVGNYAAL